MKAILLTLLPLLCLKVSGSVINKQQIRANDAELSGSVTSQQGKPLAGVTVTLLKEPGNAERKFAITTDSGTYRFLRLDTGSYTLALSHAACKPITMAVRILPGTRQVRLPVLALSELSRALAEVAIQSNPTALIEQRLDRTVIRVGSLLSNNGLSAAEVLGNSPGVEITENAVSLQGKSGVTVFVDGRQLFLEGQALISYLKSLPSSTLETVELMPNPPARYQSSAGGVINIVTKRTKTAGVSGNLSGSLVLAHSVNHNETFNLVSNKGKVSLYLNLGYNDNTLHYLVRQQRKYVSPVASLAQDIEEVDRTKSYRGRFGLDYRKGKFQTFSLSADGFTSPYQERGDYFLQFARAAPDSTIRTSSTLRRSSRNAGLNAGYRRSFEKKTRTLAITMDYMNYSDRARQAIRSTTYAAPGNQIAGTYALDTRSPFSADLYSMRSDLDDELWGLALSTGVQVNYTRRASGATYFNAANEIIDSLSTTQDADEKTAAAYVSINRKIGRLTVQSGLRYTHTLASKQPEYGSFLPSLHLAYKPDSSSARQLILAFSTRVDRPDYSSLNPFVFFFDRYSALQGNPDLQPARSTSLELSYNAGSSLTAGFRFRNGQDPIIQFFSLDGFSLINSSVNIRRSVYTGAFATFSFPLSSWWSANGYTELYRQVFTGPVAGGAAFRHALTSGKFQVNNQFTFGKSWNAELSGYYAGRNTLGQGVTRPILRVNSSVQKKLWQGRGSLGLSGLDIFHTSAIRRIIPLNGAEFTRRNEFDSRRLTVTCSYKFGSTVSRQIIKSGLETERQRVGGD